MRTDLRSDTVTRPTPEMRRFMLEAEVGDDVLDGDPTTAHLQDVVAKLLGKEAALFFPSGSMANEAAVAVHCPRGTEILLDAEHHIIHWEMAAAAALSGVQVRPIPSDGPVLTAGALRAGVRAPSPHAPRASLVCMENTHNAAGGVVTSLDEMRAIQSVAREMALPLHLDGARLWNAAVALGASPAEIGACCDSVMVSFSKGLGAPVGAALAGPAAFVAEARPVRKRFGGGMRQTGILAAAALYALDNHFERLAEDHENARLIAEALTGVDGLRVVTPDSNIVMLDLPSGVDAFDVVRAAADHAVLVTAWNRTRVRLVTHLDVDQSAARRAAGLLGDIISRLGAVS